MVPELKNTNLCGSKLWIFCTKQLTIIPDLKGLKPHELGQHRLS